MAKKQVAIQPLGTRVLVNPEITDGEQIIAGIIIPDSASKEKPESGSVVAVGEGVKHVAIGDKVLFSKYGFDEVKLEDEEYYIIKEDSVLAVIK